MRSSRGGALGLVLSIPLTVILLLGYVAGGIAYAFGAEALLTRVEAIFKAQVVDRWRQALGRDAKPAVSPGQRSATSSGLPAQRYDFFAASLTAGVEPTPTIALSSLDNSDTTAPKNSHNGLSRKRGRSSP